jgi:hypothetical protein
LPRAGRKLAVILDLPFLLQRQLTAVVDAPQFASAPAFGSTPRSRNINTYYDGHTGSEYSTARNESPYDPSGTGGLDRWPFDYGSSLPRGTWAVRVTGDVVGNAGGSYSATIALMPIPEPQEWGMLLAGLGVVGALARRRQARPA